MKIKKTKKTNSKKLPKKKLKVRKAFTMVELSIVILIIAIIVVGVTQSSRLIGITRLSSAKKTTEGSPVSSIRGLIGWYEATSEKSFALEEPDDGYRVMIWKDINPQEVLKNNLVASDMDSAPIFKSNCMNLLPCVEFNGAKFLNNSINFGSSNQLSIFVVFRSNSVGASVQSLISARGSRDPDSTVFSYGIHQSPLDKLYYTSSSSQSSDIYSAAKLAIRKDYLAYFIDDGFIVNQYLSDQPNTSVSSNTGTKNLSLFTVGAWDDGSFTQELFNGSISELIIFNRALKIEERKEIEKYLAKKWKIKMFDPNDCGVGCPFANFCSVSVIGSSTNYVAPGPGYAQCDQNGYSGSVGYNCQGGNASIATSCSCSDGFAKDGIYCKRVCNVAGIAGGTSTQTVFAGTGSVPCTGTGYSGSATYMCSNAGAFSILNNCSMP